MFDQRFRAQDSVIYATNLASVLKTGHALWSPEPHVTGEVHLCDVGYVSDDGAFVRLFNASPCQSRPQVEYWDPRFSSLVHLEGPAVSSIERKERAYQPDEYASDGVVKTKGRVKISASAPGPSGLGAGVSADYACSAKQGALLKLKSSALRESLYHRQDVIDYILKQHDAWFDYVQNELKLVISQEELVFVRGHVKTGPDWMAAVFSHSSTMLNAEVNASAATFAEVRGAFSKQHEIKNMPIRKRGTAYDASPPATQSSQDQCILIQRYVVKRRLFGLLGRKLKAAAGPHQLPDQPDEGDELAVTIDGMDEDESEGDEGIRSMSPVHILLDYILEVTDADVAIACEEDIASLFLGHVWPTDLAESLRTSQPQLEMFPTIQGQAGMLSLPEKIARERENVLSDGIAHSYHDDHSSGNEIPVASIMEGKVVLGSSATRSAPLRWPHAAFKNKNEENGVVTSVALSPDGSLLAVAWDDITISLWRVQDGAHVQQLDENGHSDTVWIIVFSPDGHHLASGSSDTNVIIWDVTTGQALNTLQGHSTDVAALAYSHDGSLLATGSTDGCIKVWDTATSTLRFTLQEQDAEIRQLAFSSTGSRLASCTISGLLLWDPTTGIRVASLEGHSGALWSVAFSPEGDRLITGSEDNTARIWDASNGDELVTLQEHGNSVWAVAFSPDGMEVATASYDGTVATCDSFTGERHHVFNGPHSSPIVEAVAYSKEHDFIASGSADGIVRVWNSKSGAPIAEFRGHEEKVRGVVFTPNGWDLVSHAEDGTVRVWSVLDATRL